MTTLTPIVPQHILDRYLTDYSNNDLYDINMALQKYRQDIAALRARLKVKAHKDSVIIDGPDGVGKSSLMRSINDHVCIDYERALRRFDDVQQILSMFEGTNNATDILRDTSRKWLKGSKRNADIILNELVLDNMPVAFETTGHGAGMTAFLRNFASAGYTTRMWLCDAPAATRKEALDYHFYGEQGTYTDPAVNEAKIKGIGQNLRNFAENVCELSIYGRTDKSKPLQLLATSSKDGHIDIKNPNGLIAFSDYSDVMADSEYRDAFDLLDHHYNTRLRATHQATTPDESHYWYLQATPGPR